jgi:hypothetical protein
MFHLKWLLFIIMFPDKNYSQKRPCTLQDDGEAQFLFFQANGGGAADWIWVGFEQYNNTGARNSGWGFGKIDGTVTPSTYVPWASGNPSNTITNTRTVYVPSYGGVIDQDGQLANSGNECYCMCEYGKKSLYEKL